jgi:multisubunit Na+/H+ antiporter MnhF subunit
MYIKVDLKSLLTSADKHANGPIVVPFMRTVAESGQSTTRDTFFFIYLLLFFGFFFFFDVALSYPVEGFARSYCTFPLLYYRLVLGPVFRDRILLANN